MAVPTQPPINLAPSNGTPPVSNPPVTPPPQAAAPQPTGATWQPAGAAPVAPVTAPIPSPSMPANRASLPPNAIYPAAAAATTKSKAVKAHSDKAVYILGGVVGAIAGARFGWYNPIHDVPTPLGYISLGLVAFQVAAVGIASGFVTKAFLGGSKGAFGRTMDAARITAGAAAIVYGFGFIGSHTGLSPFQTTPRESYAGPFATVPTPGARPAPSTTPDGLVVGTIRNAANGVNSLLPSNAVPADDSPTIARFSVYKANGSVLMFRTADLNQAVGRTPDETEYARRPLVIRAGQNVCIAYQLEGTRPDGNHELMFLAHTTSDRNSPVTRLFALKRASEFTPAPDGDECDGLRPSDARTPTPFVAPVTAGPIRHDPRILRYLDRPTIAPPAHR